MKRVAFIGALAALALCCDRQGITTDGAGLTLSKAMGAVEGEDFEKALEPRRFHFPADHGPHPSFRTEWWYFTGNLSSDEGKRFGYQFTLFRTALSAQAPERQSPWASNQIYMAHLAVTDIASDEFFYSERFSRGGAGLAGAQASPLRAWLEDWEVVQTGPTAAYELPDLRVRAGTEGASIDLALVAVKPAVLQGERGLSQKGPQAGNASHYYSYTRLATRGTITVNGSSWSARGYSWMDREWSTSALGVGQIGWDWFALQLDDNSELMFYQMRRSDGTPDAFSKGTFVESDGSTVALRADDVRLSVTDTWKSERGSVYPSTWRLQVPSVGLDLVITPAVKDQLLDVSIDYWEGSVSVEGTRNGARLLGRGYVELTGY